MGATVSTMLQQTLNEIYRTKITNIVKTSAVAASTMLAVNQNISVNIKCSGDLHWDCTDWEWNQSIQAQVNVVSSIDQTQASDISSLITNDIENESSQTMESIFNVLSGIGEARVQTQSTEFITRVHDIITNNVTSEFIINIVNQNTFNQNNELTVKVDGNCYFSGEKCKMLQDVSVSVVAENIINTLVTIVSRDEAINRIVSDSKQDLKVEARGWDVVIKAATGVFAMILVILVCVFMCIVKSSPHSTILRSTLKSRKAVMIALVIICLLCGLGVFLVYAGSNKMWPFDGGNQVRWVAETVADFKTGKCIASTESKVGYTSREECESSHSVDQYWGCEKLGDTYTGRCTQYKTASEGPKRSKSECEAAIAMTGLCSPKYGCGRAESGVYTFPPTCVVTPAPDQARWVSETECTRNRKQCLNRWKIADGTCIVAHPENDWGMYETEQECKRAANMAATH